MIRLAPAHRGPTGGSSAYPCVMWLRHAQPSAAPRRASLGRGSLAGSPAGRRRLPLRLPALPPTDGTVPAVVPHQGLPGVRDVRRERGRPVAGGEHLEVPLQHRRHPGPVDAAPAWCLIPHLLLEKGDRRISPESARRPSLSSAPIGTALGRLKPEWRQPGSVQITGSSIRRSRRSHWSTRWRKRSSRA